MYTKVSIWFYCSSLAKLINNTINCIILYRYHVLEGLTIDDIYDCNISVYLFALNEVSNLLVLLLRSWYTFSVITKIKYLQNI